jgi:hypothetical protein
MNVVDRIADTNVIDISYAVSGFTDFPYPLVVISSAKITTPGYWLNADINNDGIANLKDYAYLAANWKKSGSNLWGDLNLDNVVDMRDVSAFSQSWLKATSWYKPIAEDINNDGIVNFKDYAQLIAEWGMSGKMLGGDLNNDLSVNYLDLLRLADHWLECNSLILPTCGQ